jgi:hypothetical protein
MIQVRVWLALCIILISVAPTSISTSVGAHKYPPLSPLRPEEKGLPYPLRVRDGITEEWRDGARRGATATHGTQNLQASSRSTSHSQNGETESCNEPSSKQISSAGSVPMQKPNLAGMSLADIRQKFPLPAKAMSTPQRTPVSKLGMQKPASPTHALLADAAAKARAVPLEHRKFPTTHDISTRCPFIMGPLHSLCEGHEA